MKHAFYDFEENLPEHPDDFFTDGFHEQSPTEESKRRAEVRKLIELRLDAKRVRRELSDFDEEDFE